MKFLDVTAWIFAMLSTGLIALRLVGIATYSDLHKLQDQLRGIQRTYPLKWPGVVAIVCWAWIVSGGL